MREARVADRRRRDQQLPGERIRIGIVGRRRAEHDRRGEQRCQAENARRKGTREKTHAVTRTWVGEFRRANFTSLVSGPEGSLASWRVA